MGTWWALTLMFFRKLANKEYTRKQKDSEMTHDPADSSTVSQPDSQIMKLPLEQALRTQRPQEALLLGVPQEGGVGPPVEVP